MKELFNQLRTAIEQVYHGDARLKYIGICNQVEKSTSITKNILEERICELQKDLDIATERLLKFEAEETKGRC